MGKAGEWELCGSTGAGADQGFSYTQRKGNAMEVDGNVKETKQFEKSCTWVLHK